MKRSTLFLDPQRRVLPSLRVAIAATLAGLALGAGWHLAGDDDAAPAAASTADRNGAPSTAALPATVAAPTAPGPGVPSVQSVPAATIAPVTTAAPAAPLSREVAPGMHVTPMTLPPGATVPQPAGPSAHDSEPEN